MTDQRSVSDAMQALLELRRVGMAFCCDIARWTGPRLKGSRSPLADYLGECQAQLRALSEPVPGIDDGEDALEPEAEALRLDCFLAAVRHAARDRPTRILQLSRALDLSAIELDLILLAALPEASSLFGTLFASLTGQSEVRRPTVQLALNFCTKPEQRTEVLQALCSGGLANTGMLCLEPASAPLADRMLCLAPEVWPTLCGVDYIDPLLRPLLQPAPPELTQPLLPPGQTAEVEVLAERLAVGQVTRVVVAGPPGCGRRTLTRWLLGRAGRSTIEIKLGGGDAPSGWAAAAVRHALLRDAALVLVAEPGLGNTLSLPLWPPAELPCIVCLPARGDVGGAAFTGATRVNLDLPRARERARLWAHALGATGGPEPELLARRYHLNGSEINAIAAAARMQALADQRSVLTEEDIAQCLRQRPAAHLETFAQRRRPQVAWNDLILPPATLTQVEELISRMTCRDQVFHEWGLAPGQHQTGTVTLFTGPSGTGKTLGAEVLAARLGLELFCIDLSRVVSKYIGETERNLAGVFDAAEGAAAVLFFDEADALFGRRTETRDAHDRYANQEVSYLLTRLEAFAGLAVLASNLRQNMDSAFLRRFDFIIEFNLPDEEARRRLWQRHLRCQAPVDRGVDAGVLAEAFAVSGGHIRNAVVGAAFRAASTGSAITMEHLIAAMRREYEKLGKAFPGACLTSGDGGQERWQVRS